MVLTPQFDMRACVIDDDGLPAIASEMFHLAVEDYMVHHQLGEYGNTRDARAQPYGKGPDVHALPHRDNL